MQGDSHAVLTRTERSMLGLLLRGLDHGQVAAALGVALSTTHWHARNLHAKTETHTPAQLVLWAVEHRQCCLWPRSP